MSKPPATSGTVSPESAEAEPKGLPNSDRYRAETAHTTEPDAPPSTQKEPVQQP